MVVTITVGGGFVNRTDNAEQKAKKKSVTQSNRDTEKQRKKTVQ
jgi:hypothetical protein